MCLAVPGEIISVSRDHHAVVSFNGVEKKISVELVPGIKPGNWVTVHAGFAIGKLSRLDAKKNQELINDFRSQKNNK